VVLVHDAVLRCIVASEVKGRSLHSLTVPSDLYSALVEFIHGLYFKWLLVNPKDRRVVVVENVLGPTLFRETLARVLFRHYEVSSVLFAPSHLVCLFGLGVRTGLVVDCGHKETTAIPVYEGVPVLAAWQAQPLAGEAVEAAVRADLACRGLVTPGEGGRVHPVDPDLLTPDLVADVALRCCFITSLQRGRQLCQMVSPDGADALATWLARDAAPTVVMPCGGDKLLQVDGVTREASAELLWAIDEDNMSVACMVLDAIAASPIDCRKELAAGLVLVGGTAMMPGFRARLGQELKSLLATPKYQNLKIDTFKMFQPPAQLNYACWLGKPLDTLYTMRH
jgi:actin-related protein 10